MPPLQPRIRPFQAGDRAAIHAWISDSEPWRTLGYDSADWDKILAGLESDADREADVIEDASGSAAGLAVVRRRVLLGDYLEILAIAPRTRRTGLGRALLAHTERRAFARARNFYLCVSDFNTSARAFYQAQGYREIGAIPDLLVAGRAEILMRKTTGATRG